MKNVPGLKTIWDSQGWQIDATEVIKAPLTNAQFIH